MNAFICMCVGMCVCVCIFWTALFITCLYSVLFRICFKEGQKEVGGIKRRCNIVRRANRKRGMCASSICCLVAGWLLDGDGFVGLSHLEIHAITKTVLTMWLNTNNLKSENILNSLNTILIYKLYYIGVHQGIFVQGCFIVKQHSFMR